MQELSRYVVGQEERVIIKVPWEDTQITIPLNLSEPREGIIYKIIREMKREIAELQKQLAAIKEEQNHCLKCRFENMSDEKAEQKLLDYLRGLKNDVSETTIFEISQNTNLPADQVERVIEKFEKEGKIRWVEQ